MSSAKFKLQNAISKSLVLLVIVLLVAPFSLKAQVDSVRISLTITGSGTCTARVGSVTVQLPALLPVGANLSLTAGPSNGWKVKKWDNDNTSNSRTIVIPTTDFEYTLEFERRQYNMTLNSVEGGHVEDTNGNIVTTQQLIFDTTVRYIAIPDSGYTFTSWFSYGKRTDNPLNFTQSTSAVNLTPKFDHIKYTITYNRPQTLESSGKIKEERLVKSDNCSRTSGQYHFKDTVTFRAVPDSGYHFVGWSDGCTDTVRTLVVRKDTSYMPIFARNPHTVEFLTFDNRRISKKTYLFKDVIEQPVIPARGGWLIDGWARGESENVSAVPLQQPDEDLVFKAKYHHNLYDVTWSGVTGLVYEGHNFYPRASYRNDDGVLIENSGIFLKYYYLNGEVYMEQDGIMDAGDYKIVATAKDPNYWFDRQPGNDTLYITVAPAPLKVVGITIEPVKMYDGNNTVEVTFPGTLQVEGRTELGVYTCDNGLVTHVPTVTFNSAYPGYNKPIMATFELYGSRISNYVCPSPVILTDTGRILQYITLTDDYSIIVRGTGYCEGEQTYFSYNLDKGEPKEFQVLYSSDAKRQGFEDIQWTPLSSLERPDQIPLIIPDTCWFGDYTLYLQLRNELMQNSEPIEVQFTVNLSNRLFKTTFANVISLDLNQLQLESYQWYHDGQKIDGANLSYYHSDQPSLSGSYYLGGIYDGKEVRGCSLEGDKFIIQPDESLQAISISPNPATIEAMVEVEGRESQVHQIQIVNTMGQRVWNTSFVGNQYKVPVAQLPKGNYFVIVDGKSQRLVVYGK